MNKLASVYYRRVLPVTLTARLLVFGAAPTAATLVARPAVQAAPATESVREVLNASELLADTNAARTAEGLRPLRQSPVLAAAARAKATDMLERKYWDHFRPDDGKAPWDFMKEGGYTYRVAGENLARGFTGSKQITDAWLASPAHRANLLAAAYVEVGFATVMGTDAGGSPALLTVQFFGTPR